MSASDRSPDKSHRSPLARAKLMLDAKVVIEHYNRIIETIDEHRLVLDRQEADFVMTVEDYQTLRDFACRNDAPPQAINLEGVDGDEMDKGADRAALLTRLMAAGEPRETIPSHVAEKPAPDRLYEIEHALYHFLESGEERVSDSELAFDLPNEDYNKLISLIGDQHPVATASVPSTIAPNLREIAKRHARNAVAPIGSREHENMDAIIEQNIVRQEEIIYWAMREAHRVFTPSATPLFTFEEIALARATVNNTITLTATDHKLVKLARTILRAADGGKQT